MHFRLGGGEGSGVAGERGRGSVWTPRAPLTGRLASPPCLSRSPDCGLEDQQCVNNGLLASEVLLQGISNHF